MQASARTALASTESETSFLRARRQRVGDASPALETRHTRADCLDDARAFDGGERQRVRVETTPVMDIDRS